MIVTTVSLRKVKLKIETQYQGLKLRTVSLDAATIFRCCWQLNCINPQLRGELKSPAMPQQTTFWPQRSRI
jgi:hypothetical protein